MSRPKQTRRHVVVLSAAVLVAVLVVVVSALNRGNTGPDRSGLLSRGGPSGMEHIHGLGINPADGTVYAGTHYGLFRIGTDGEAIRVADRVQDFMGFTVAGPGRFLASGHPGEGQGGPGSIGLIESTDAGENWQQLSLSGEADFHALEYRHGKVFGLNAMTGQLLVSDDMKNWEELARVTIADFAVSPTNADTLVATTEQGLAITSDGAKNFNLVEGAPLLVFVSWAEDGTLAGVTPEGVVYTSTDPTGSWTERGNLGGRPEALTARSANELYAAADATVLRSTDGGETFTVLYPR